MASNKYQYGTSPKKLQPDYNKKKKTKKKQLKVVEELPRQDIKVSKEEKQKQFKITVLVVAIFAILLTISYRNSKIDEKFNEIQELKKDLSSMQKENEQLKVSIENSFNITYIEQMAKEKLGMQKLTNKQTVYISLPKKDYIESTSEKVIINKANWFEEFTNKFFKK